MAMSDGGSHLVAMSTHTPPSLKAILTRFRTRISITFGLLTVENVVEVATPFLLGLAIDGLLSGSAGEIWLLAGILVLGTITGTGRRLFDTRAYTDIHVQLAGETAAHGWRNGLPISALNARTELLREMVSFFEEELVETYGALVKTLGALLMLWFLLPSLTLLVLGAGFLILLVYLRSAKRIYRFNRGLNDRWERQVATLERRSRKETAAHFRAMARWQIRLSDLEAMNYGGIALILIAMILGAIAVTTASGVNSPGAVFAVLVYVLDISEGAWLLPMAFQQFVRIREISQRMAQQGDADPTNSAASKPSSGAISGGSLQGCHQPD